MIEDRKRALTEDEIVDIIRRERDYWLRQEDESSGQIVLGAVGALANVLAIIYGIEADK